MSDNILSIIDEEGKTKYINVIKYFKLKSTNKEYIIYNDTKLDNRIKKVYASEVIEDDKNIYLKPISNEDKNIINKIMRGLNNG